MRKPRRIAVLLATDLGAHRAILRGIRRYVATGSPWMLRVAWPLNTPIQVISEWNPDGIIAKIFTPELLTAIQKLKTPLINISNISGDMKLPRVAADEDSIGHAAADHFLERGFRHFAFFGYRQQRAPSDRGLAYQARLKAAGFDCHTYFSSTLPTLRPGGMWGSVDAKASAWLLSLPRPVAIFAYHDFLAWEVAELCHAAGLQVPEDVALLGADNDELFCELCHPPLSSITYPAERIGFEAASMLDKWLAGKSPSRKPLLLASTGIVTRQSSDIVAIDDPDLSAAVRYIRQNAGEQIAVKHILQHVPVSRRSLEQKFRTVLKRSPQEEIGRVRLERAQQLLTQTELTMPEVARHAGFSNAERLSVVFKQQTGLSPTEYRKKNS